LRCAIAVGRLDPDEKFMDDEAFVDTEILIDVCAGIVTTDLESDTSIIRLVHYTTQQYFERNRATIFPDAQTQISRTCLRYLSLEEFSLPCTSYADTYRRKLQSPFFSYAATNWGLHVAHSPEKEVSKELNQFFYLTHNLHSSIGAIVGIELESWNDYLSGRNSLDSSLWLASFFGLTQVVQNLVLEGADVNVRIWVPRQKVFHSAIRNSCNIGNGQIFKLLLDKGAIINNTGEKQMTLLALAAFKGHLDLVQMLVDRGCDIRAPDPDYGSVLRAAVVGQSVATCQYLIDRGSDVEFWQAPSGTALGLVVAQRVKVSI
jgi:hypothetical protein